MIKVCHMTSAHGVEDIRIFHKECVSLAQAGYDVYLVERGQSYEKNGVHVVGVGDIPSGKLKRMTTGAKMVYQKALEIDADLYQFHDPELLPYGLKLKKMGKKVVFDSHEYTRAQITNRDYLPKWIAGIVSKLFGTYEDHVLRKIDGVFFPCPMDGKFPFKCKNTAYLDNLPRLSEIYDKYDPSVPREEDSVGLIGSLTYERGVKHLVMAVGKAGCKALVGGVAVPQSFGEELAAMPESKNVQFLGKLNRDQVVDTLNRIKIGISAPLNVGQYDKTDNLSTKCCEYMSMGLPVIITRHAFNERMLDQYHFGVCIDPENVEEYAEAIRDLLDNPDKAWELGQNGRRLIKEKLNWEIEQQHMLDLYKKVLKN